MALNNTQLYNLTHASVLGKYQAANGERFIDTPEMRATEQEELFRRQQEALANIEALNEQKMIESNRSIRRQMEMAKTLAYGRDILARPEQYEDGDAQAALDQLSVNFSNYIGAASWVRGMEENQPRKNLETYIGMLDDIYNAAKDNGANVGDKLADYYASEELREWDAIKNADEATRMAHAEKKAKEKAEGNERLTDIMKKAVDENLFNTNDTTDEETESYVNAHSDIPNMEEYRKAWFNGKSAKQMMKVHTDIINARDKEIKAGVFDPTQEFDLAYFNAKRELGKLDDKPVYDTIPNGLKVKELIKAEQARDEWVRRRRMLKAYEEKMDEERRVAYAKSVLPSLTDPYEIKIALDAMNGEDLSKYKGYLLQDNDRSKTLYAITSVLRPKGDHGAWEDFFFRIGESGRSSTYKAYEWGRTVWAAVNDWNNTAWTALGYGIDQAKAVHEDWVRYRKELGEEIKKDLAFYRTHEAWRPNDDEDWAEQAVKGLADSSFLQGTAILAGGAKMASMGLSRVQHPYARAAATALKGVSYLAEALGAASMVGEQYENMLMNGVDNDRAATIALFAGAVDWYVERMNIDSYLGLNMTPAELRRSGIRALFKAVAKRDPALMARMIKTDIKQAMRIALSEAGEELLQGWNQAGALAFAQGDGSDVKSLLQAYLNKESIRQGVDSFIDALPTCTAFGVMGVSSPFRSGLKESLGAYEELRAEVVRKYANENNIDTANNEEMARAERIVNERAAEHARATVGMNSAKRAEYFEKKNEMSPTEAAFYEQVSEYYNELNSLEGSQWANSIIRGEINYGYLEKMGFKPTFENGQLKTIRVGNDEYDIVAVKGTELATDANTGEKGYSRGHYENKTETEKPAWVAALRNKATGKIVRLGNSVTINTPTSHKDLDVQQKDGTWKGVAYTSTIPHELTHAFLNEVAQSDLLSEEQKKEFAGILKGNKNEALAQVVEYLVTGAERFFSPDVDVTSVKNIVHNIFGAVRKAATLGWIDYESLPPIVKQEGSVDFTAENLRDPNWWKNEFKSVLRQSPAETAYQKRMFTTGLILENELQALANAMLNPQEVAANIKASEEEIAEAIEANRKALEAERAKRIEEYKVASERYAAADPTDDEAVKKARKAFQRARQNLRKVNSQLNVGNHIRHSFADETTRYSTTYAASAQAEYDKVVAAYTNPDGTKKRSWMKAPNGKPTNLTERQWVQVRTPQFKEWFGDWEKACKFDLLFAINPVIIDKPAPVGKDVEIAYKALAEATNKDGRNVRFVKSVLGKILRHKGYDTRKVVPYLKEIFEDAEYLGSVRDLGERPRGDGTMHKEHRNIEWFHNYLGKFRDGVTEYFVRFTIQEVKTRSRTYNPNEFHSTYISDVELYKNTDQLALNTSNSEGKVGAVGFDSIVANYLDEFKRAKDESSKVVDENGEPLVVYHETRNEFTVFDKNKVGRTGKADTRQGEAYFFTTDLYLASNAARFNGSGNVIGNPYDGETRRISAFLKIKNPVFVGAEYDDGKIVEDENYREGNISKLKNAIATGKANGNDGVWEVYRTNEGAWVDTKVGADGYIRDNEGSPEVTNRGGTFVAFSPTQIKSATDNVGAFDATNPDIRYSLAEPTGQQKSASVAYPDASADVRAMREQDGARYSFADEAKALILKKRPDMEGTNYVSTNIGDYINQPKEIQEKWESFGTNPWYNEEFLKWGAGIIVDRVVGEIMKFPDSKTRKASLNWFIKGAIRLPEDAPKVSQAIEIGDASFKRVRGFEEVIKNFAKTMEVAHKNLDEAKASGDETKISRAEERIRRAQSRYDEAVEMTEKAKRENPKYDPLAYESPMQMIQALKEFKPREKPIDPDTVPELSDKRDMGNGVVTYLVQDDRAGQQAMRRILNTHKGEDFSPWCLLHGDGTGGLSDGRDGGYDAWYYWNLYNAMPKRVAFKDGKLLAFMATDKSPDGRTIDDVKERYDEVVNELKRGLYENYGFYSEEYQRIKEINEVIENIEEYGDKEEIYKAINFVGEDLKKRIESIDDEDTKSIESITAEVIESLKDSITKQEESWYEWVEENVELVEQDGVYFILDPEGDRVGLWVDDHGNAVDEFDSKANGEEQWWDFDDHSHEGIPLGNMAVPNDPFGRWADFEIRDGELTNIGGGFHKGNVSGTNYTKWYENGNKMEEMSGADIANFEYKEWNEDGTLALFKVEKDADTETYFRYEGGDVEGDISYGGKLVKFDDATNEMISDARRIYAENDQRLNKAFNGESVSANENPIAAAPAADQERYSLVSYGEAAGIDVRMENERPEFYYKGDKIVTKKGKLYLGTQEVTDSVIEGWVERSPIGALLRTTVDNGYITEENRASQVKFFAGLLGLFMRNRDIAQTQQFVGSMLFTGMKENSDKQYKTTFDFPSICTKTQAVIDSMSAAAVAKDGGLTTEEILKIYRTVATNGLPVPCPECYVFSRWIGVGGLLDNIHKYQLRFGEMTPENVKAQYATFAAQIEAVAAENGLSFGKAKGKLGAEFTKQYTKLLDKVEKARNQGQEVSEKDEQMLAVLESNMDTVKAMTWIETVYFADAAMTKRRGTFAVPSNILFDLNRTEEFSRDYPQAWAFRCTQGAGYGKAITPYAEEVLGEGISIEANKKMIKDKQAWARAHKGERMPNDFLMLDADGNLSKAALKKLANARRNEFTQAFIGGQRIQSTSDARPENMTDYIIALLEMQAMGSFGQGYSKVLGAIPMLNAAGFSMNMSLMPLGGGLDKNGVPVDTSWGGVPLEEMRDYRAKYDHAGSITVGANDQHIRALMRQAFRDFIIPYHASGGKADVVNEMRKIQERGKKLNLVRSTDYTTTQGEKVLSDLRLAELGYTPEDIELVKKRREARIAILAGKGEKDMEVIRGSKFLSHLYDMICEKDGEWYGVKVPKGIIGGQIFPNEYWNKSLTYDESAQITRDYLDYCRELGILHKFSGMKVTKDGLKVANGYDAEGNKVPMQDLAYVYDANGNRTEEIEPFFWKVLIDRRMFDNEGRYIPQTRINLNAFDVQLATSFANHITGAVYDQAKSLEVARGIGRDVKAGRFSLAGQNSPTADMEYLIAHETFARNGKAPTVEEVGAMMKKAGVAGDPRTVLANALLDANDMIGIYNKAATDPVIKDALEKAGLAYRQRLAQSRAKRTIMKFDSDLSKKREAIRKAYQSQIDNVTGMNYREMMTYYGLDMNELLKAMPPKARKQVEKKLEEGATDDTTSPVQLTPEEEQMVADVAKVIISRGKGLAEEAEKDGAEESEEETKSSHATDAQAPGDEEIDADADDIAKGNAINAAIMKAIKESGISISNPIAMVSLIRRITEDYILRNPDTVKDLDPSNVFKSRVALARLASNLSSFAQAVAEGYAPSYARVRIARRCAELDAKGLTTLRQVERVGESIFNDLNQDVIRQSRNELMKTLHKGDKKTGWKGLDYYAKKHGVNMKESDRTVSAFGGAYIKFLRRAVDMSEAAVEKRSQELEDLIDSFTDVEDKEKFRDYENAKLELDILTAYGALRTKMPAQIEDASKLIMKFVAEDLESLEKRKEEFEKKRVELRDKMAAGIKGDPKLNGRDEDREVGFLYSLMGMLEVRASILTSRCKDAAVREDALNAFGEMERALFHCATLEKDFVNNAREGMRNVIGEVFGRWFGSMQLSKLLDTKLDEATCKKLDRGDQHTQWRIGNVMQMYVSVVQSDYADNISQHGRDGDYAAQLKDIIEQADPRLMTLIERMRGLYADYGAQISATTMAVSGVQMQTPNPLYMPVSIRRPLRGKTGESRQFSAYAPALTPRVKHGLDFDQTADIMSVWMDRVTQSAHSVGYLELSPIIQGTLQSSTLLEKINSAWGKKAYTGWNDYVFNILSGARPKGTSMDKFAQFLSKTTSRMFMWGNLGSNLNQLSAIFTSALSRDAGGITGMLKNVGMWGLKPAQMWKTCQDLTSTRAFKGRYGSDLNAAVTAARREGKYGVLKGVGDKVTDIGMAGLTLMDKVGVMALANVYYSERKALEEGGMAPEEASEQAAEKLVLLADKTAQGTNAMNATDFQQNAGVWGNLFLQFKTAPLQQFQYEYAAYVDWMADKTNGAKARKLVAALVVNHILANIVPLAVAAMMTAIYGAINDDDDPEKEREKLVARTVGQVFGGSYGAIPLLGTLVDCIGSFIGGFVATGEAPNLELAVGGLPTDTAAGMAARVAKGLANHGGDLIEAVRMDSVEDIHDAITEMAKDVTSLTWPGRQWKRATREGRKPQGPKRN